MCSSTSSAPFRAMCTETSAWTSVYDFADAAPVTTSARREDGEREAATRSERHPTLRPAA